MLAKAPWMHQNLVSSFISWMQRTPFRSKGTPKVNPTIQLPFQSFRMRESSLPADSVDGMQGCRLQRIRRWNYKSYWGATTKAAVSAPWPPTWWRLFKYRRARNEAASEAVHYTAGADLLLIRSLLFKPSGLPTARLVPISSPMILE